MNVFTSASESECNLAADGLRGNTSRSVSNLEPTSRKGTSLCSFWSYCFQNEVARNLCLCDHSEMIHFVSSRFIFAVNCKNSGNCLHTVDNSHSHSLVHDPGCRPQLMSHFVILVPLFAYTAWTRLDTSLANLMENSPALFASCS